MTKDTQQRLEDIKTKKVYATPPFADAAYVTQGDFRFLLSLLTTDYTANDKIKEVLQKDYNYWDSVQKNLPIKNSSASRLNTISNIASALGITLEAE